MDSSPQGIGSKTGILMLIGLFILTAVFASASVFVIKKRVQEKKQQTTTQVEKKSTALDRTSPSPTNFLHPIRPTIPESQIQTAQRPITTSASSSAQ